MAKAVMASFVCGFIGGMSLRQTIWFPGMNFSSPSFRPYKSGRWDPSKVDTVLPRIAKMADTLNGKVTPSHGCNLTSFGQGWGAHSLCNSSPMSPCHFFSFGISHDYSFDTDLAERWGCNGFAADPTVSHNSSLHRKVTFHEVGAAMLQSDVENEYELTTTIPALLRWTNIPRLAALKMDCEGCEYSLSHDVLVEDPEFFMKIDQLAIELHMSRNWVKSRIHLYSLGMLLTLLDDAGLVLQDAEIVACGQQHERMGCMEELISVGYPCGSGRSCHNLLFARIS